MTSSVPLAKAGLLTVLEVALTPVQVSWAHPGGDIAYESVWVDDAQITETASIGQVSHRETYILPIVVSVSDQGNDARRAEERAWVLTGLVETAVRANPSLNTATVTGAVVTGKVFQSFVEGGTRVAECSVSVMVKSKVT